MGRPSNGPPFSFGSDATRPTNVTHRALSALSRPLGLRPIIQRRSRGSDHAGDLPFVIRTLVDNQRGASSTEYALVAALIPIAAITAMGLVGQEIQNKPGIGANGFT